MKNDTTTTMLNFVLAVLVILGVVFALMTTHKVNKARSLQQPLMIASQRFQSDLGRMQALLNDVIIYNKTANSPELAQLIKEVQAPAPAAANK
jgi:hypothetical protein